MGNGGSSRAALGLGYAGDIAPREGWDLLVRDPRAQLIDVRTEAEWAFVGIPDLTTLRRDVLLYEWQRFPTAPNPNFIDEIREALASTSYERGASLLFLCRSGGRSRAAAVAMTAGGFAPCFNIKDGFEGALDSDRHRGQAAGWKAEGLPWIQS